MTAALASNSPVRGGGDQLTFRFADVNPLTGRAFRSSRFYDLPLFVGYRVEHLGFSDREWNELVAKGEVAEQVDCFREHTIPWTLNRPLRKPRTGQPPAGKCEDCHGTCVDIDADGSFTGVVGASFVCCCARG